MASAVAVVENGFSPPGWGQVGPVDESLAPTCRTPEAAPAHEPAVRAVMRVCRHCRVMRSWRNSAAGAWPSSTRRATCAASASWPSK
jgi:hypothetical protein